MMKEKLKDKRQEQNLIKSEQIIQGRILEKELKIKKQEQIQYLKDIYE